MTTLIRKTGWFPWDGMSKGNGVKTILLTDRPSKGKLSEWQDL